MNMDPEIARKSLIELIEKTDRPDLKVTLSMLKTATVKDLGQGRIALGKWICNLTERTFVISIDADPIFAEYGGVFKSLDGKWVAVIEREVRN